MQNYLFAREEGNLRHRELAQTVASSLLRSFALAPQHRFDGDVNAISPRENSSSNRNPAVAAVGGVVNLDRPHDLRAHGAGTASLTLDKFDGRVLVSGGADGAIKIWDLEDCASQNQIHTFRPRATIQRRSAGEVEEATATRRSNRRGHSHGVTHLAFYPFDPDAFLSSSYDKTLKLWATEPCALSAEFDLNAIIYSHATSPIAQTPVVACATQHSSVRLVDLRSGSAVQALVAHGGPVLCASWSPRHEYLLASGHADGRARIWDIRRAGGVIAQLDQEDSLGVVHRHRHALLSGLDGSRSSCVPRFRSSAQAHDEAVNGLQWADDGRYIVSAGLDRRIRVWDADVGANTLVSFGSIVQNHHAKTASFIVCPLGLFADRQVLIWPNDQEILILDMHEGTVVTRLRNPGATNPLGPRGSGGGGGIGDMQRNRITNIVWRGAGGGIGQVGPMMGGGSSVGAIYSAHLNGQIRAWMPQIPGPEDVDEDDELNEDEEVQRRKRKAVDDAYRSLMGKQIKFT